MPRYDYRCPCGVTFEAVAGLDDFHIDHRCGKRAARIPVYREQYMHAETGPRGGRKNEVPREEKSYRKQFKEFQEASQEIEHAYSRVDDPKVQAPNYYKEGLKQARKREAKIAGH